MVLWKPYNTMGKTTVHEGVKRKNKSLSESFDLKYEQYKQIVWFTETFDNRNSILFYSILFLLFLLSLWSETSGTAPASSCTGVMVLHRSASGSTRLNFVFSVHRSGSGSGGDARV